MIFAVLNDFFAVLDNFRCFKCHTVTGSTKKYKAVRPTVTTELLLSRAHFKNCGGIGNDLQSCNHIKIFMCATIQYEIV